MEIYIHIPFCVRKCAYCDFLSGPADPSLKETYVQALCREINAAGAFDASAGYGRVDTVFFGGGTPSLLEAGQMERIFDHLRRWYSLSENGEITMEANPGTLTKEKLWAMKRLGVNRLSLGLQSADDTELKTLGRIHSFADFRDSFEMARKAGFGNINVDVMSALPGQSLSSYIKTLNAVTAFEPEHISAYSLIVEPGTPFEKLLDAGRLNLPDEDTERAMYAATGQILEENGYEQYEISNYARPDKACRHNIGYWTREDYRGFGLGAASLKNPVRFTNPSDMRTYLTFYGEAKGPDSFPKVRKIFDEWEILDIHRQMEETMFLGLRMRRGVSDARFLKQFGVSMDHVYGSVIRKHIKDGFLEQKTDDEGGMALSLTREGISVSNRVMADFLLDEA